MKKVRLRGLNVKQPFGPTPEHVTPSGISMSDQA
jgi:hypothetical protein